jgi:hypothetical protein
MEGMDPFKATAIWGYEDSRNRFRVFGLENMGNVASGTLMHHERRNIWTMRTRGSGPMGSTRGRGTIEFLDANTMLWCWSDYARWDVFRLFKLAEFGGTSTRM